MDKQTRRMRRILLFKLFLYGAVFSAAGNPAGDSPEQIAVDYFLANLYGEEYTEQVLFRFNGKTQPTFSRFAERSICFDKDYQLWERIEKKAKEGDASTLRIYLELKQKKYFKKSAKNILRVYKATEIDNKHYVEIALEIKKEYLHSFFFELNIDGDVLRWCKIKVVY